MSITSCVDCPSFLTGVQAAQHYQDASIKVPMCGRFGYLLGVPQAAGQAPVSSSVAEHRAKGCTKAGEPLPSNAPAKLNSTFFQPDTDLLDKRPADPVVTSCVDCKNFVHDNEKMVYACQATGKVIFNSRRSIEALGCEYRDARQGVPVEIRNGAKLSPVFAGTSGKKPPLKPKSALFKVVDPRFQSSDAPVADEHKGIIRAWITHEVGNRGKTAHYPIFETEYFGDMAHLIPLSSDTDGDPALYVDHTGIMNKFLSVSWGFGKVLCFIGEPGSGKTTGGRYLAHKLNMPFVYIPYTDQTDPTEVLGLMGLQDGNTLVQPGLLPKNVVKPCILFQDEFSLAPEACHQANRSLFDTGNQLVVYDQTFHRHEFCFPITAMNPAHDFKNIGARELASADVRRLSFHKMPLPDLDMRKRIVRTTIFKVNGVELELSVLDVIMKISDDLHQMAKDNRIAHHWTLAHDIKVAQFSIDWTLEEAYKLAYLDYCEPQAAAVTLANIKTRIPAGM